MKTSGRDSVEYSEKPTRGDRRQILHFNVTRHPTSTWIIQQLREAFPFQSALKCLIFDRDGECGCETQIAVSSMVSIHRGIRHFVRER
jgi:hypothetical protein